MDNVYLKKKAEDVHEKTDEEIFNSLPPEIQEGWTLYCVCRHKMEAPWGKFSLLDKAEALRDLKAWHVRNGGVLDDSW